MAESVPPNPDFLPPPVATLDSPPPDPARAGGSSWLPRRLGVRLTTEFDSDSSLFFHKISCKFFDSLAKLKLSFQNNDKGEISEPQLALASKYLSLHYDLEDHNALVKSSFDVGPALHFRAAHDVKVPSTLADTNITAPEGHPFALEYLGLQMLAQQGEVAMVADLAGPSYKFELSSAVPSVGLPRATFKFPLGEVSLEERDEGEEVKKMMSVNGIVKGHLLDGVCTAQYKEESLNLRYLYKDEQMAFIPSISLPSNALAFAFKRRFGPSDKLSYWYNFDSNFWSTVYKRTVGKEYKFKVGYDSEVQLGWASLWIGDESGKAKTAPMKMKIQFMLQVPRDDIKSSALMFRVKKRWDI